MELRVLATHPFQDWKLHHTWASGRLLCPLQRAGTRQISVEGREEGERKGGRKEEGEREFLLKNKDQKRYRLEQRGAGKRDSGIEGEEETKTREAGEEVQVLFLKGVLSPAIRLNWQQV